MFTDDAIEVCIKKFVHFLRKGFIKIITNISCLKAGENEAEGLKAHDENWTNLSDAKFKKKQLQEEPHPIPHPHGSAAILSAM